jgi:tetratricopeptide (TPR) repeat protein
VPTRPEPPPPPPDTKDAPRIATQADPEAQRQAGDQIAAGVQALQAGHHGQAIEHFSQAIRLDPANPVPLLRRAGVYARNEVENWPGAIADASAVLQRDGRNIAAYETRAYAYYRSGEFRRAVADATEILRLDPNHLMAYSHRGSAYAGLREWDHAIADLSKFLASNPRAAWPTFLRGQAYQGKGEDDHALVDFNRAIELNPNIHHFWIARGELRTRKRDVTGALADLTEAIRVSSSNLDKYACYAARANCERALSLIDPAIADYSEAIRLDRKRVESQDFWILWNRGIVYVARGELDRGLADLDEAIRLVPRSDWNLYNSRAVAHVRKGQFDQAIADFETARNIPGLDKFLTSACFLGRGDCLVMAGRIAQAEAAYAECLKLDPGRAYGVLVNRAWLIDRPRGDYGAALSKLDEVAKSGMIYQFLYRGLIYTRIGLPEKALADFEEVMKRAKVRGDWFALPDYLCRWLALLIGRGEAYLLKGDLDRALAECDEAVRFALWSAEARLLRAEVLAKRGKDDLAAADRREAQRLTPDPLLARPEPRSSNLGHGRSVP